MTDTPTPHNRTSVQSPEAVQLHLRRYGALNDHTKPAVVILHGLFGTADNWATHARALSERYRVYVPDLRNHGHSPWATPADYPAMAADVLEMLRVEGLIDPYGDSAPPIVVGHSMGGKVAMTLALFYPEVVRKLCVVDMPTGPTFLETQRAYANAMMNLPVESLKSRADAEEALREGVREEGVRQFLLKSLERDASPEEGGFRWRFNLEGITEGLDEVTRAVPDSGEPYPGRTLFIKGDLSHYLEPVEEMAAAARALFPDLEVVVIQGAGHWLHAEQPVRFLEVLEEFLEG